MKSKKVTITLPVGVHARPASIFVRAANQFPCEIEVEKDDQIINGKSIMGLMMLALTRGTEVIIRATGKKEKEAVEVLSALMASDFEVDDD